MRKYLCNLRTYYVNFRATSLKYCYLHVLNFYLDNGVMTTPKRRFLSFAFTVLSFKKSLLIRILKRDNQLHLFRRLEQCSKKQINCDGSIEFLRLCSVLKKLLLTLKQILLTRRITNICDPTCEKGA